MTNPACGKPREAECGTISRPLGKYAITVSGGVYRDGTRLRAWIDPDGYWRVRVRGNGKTREVRVAHLVAMTWLGIDPRRDGAAIWPLDGDASNHHASNLVAIPRTSEAARFEKDTRVSSDFDADQSRRMRREWLSRQIIRLCETEPPKVPDSSKCRDKSQTLAPRGSRSSLQHSKANASNGH